MIKKNLIDFDEAVIRLENNEIICVPTDTVYGLICKATNENRIKLENLKGNESGKKYSIMVENKQKALALWAKNPLVWKLVNDYFPGPVTIIALKNMSRDFLGIRIPEYEKLLSLIKEVGPIFATSTNKNKKTPLNDVNAIYKYFPNIKILKGKCLNKLPSTIVKVDGKKIEIIRKGNLEIKM